MKYLKYILLLIFIWFSACLVGTKNSYCINTKIIAFQKKMDALAIEFDSKKIEDISSVKQIIQSLFEFDQTVGKEFLTDFHNPEVAVFVEKMSRQNTEQIKKILAIHGWPSISKFGKDADMQMWLLVQHADHDPIFQAGIAFLLEQLVPHGETDIKNFAYLYDRVALKFQKLGLKQRYGTQVKIKDNTIKLKPSEGNLEEINKIRKSIGLESVDEYLKKTLDLYTTNKN